MSAALRLSLGPRPPPPTLRMLATGPQRSALCTPRRLHQGSASPPGLSPPPPARRHRTCSSRDSRFKCVGGQRTHSSCAPRPGHTVYAAVCARDHASAMADAHKKRGARARGIAERARERERVRSGWEG
eukprot:3209427-Rhodomonas_salina.1